MYREYKEMVEQTVKEWSCDMEGCGLTVTRNSGCCGTATIMTCDFCGKHCCGKHRTVYYENEWTDDYPKFTACDECSPQADVAYEIAKIVAGRYDSFRDVALEIYNNMEDYEMYIDEIEPSPVLEMLWETDRYDCPLTGFATHNGDLCWFEIDDWDEYDTEYNLYKLTYGQAQTEQSRHAMFQELVGYHCDHVPSVYKNYKKTGREEEFYQARKSWEREDYKENEYLGKFRWDQFKYYKLPRHYDAGDDAES